MSEDKTKSPEREDLEAQATTLGINFHPNISDEKLLERVKEAKADDGKGDNEAGTKAGDPATPAANDNQTETQNQFRVRKQREAAELVRVQVTCMNPNKREWDGEVFTVGNRVIGTFKKYVPFDVEWHVPRAIFNVLKDRECQIFVSKKDERGRQKREGKLIKEFNVVELPKLTEEELKDLAQRQAMANGTAA